MLIPLSNNVRLSRCPLAAEEALANELRSPLQQALIDAFFGEDEFNLQAECDRLGQQAEEMLPEALSATLEREASAYNDWLRCGLGAYSCNLSRLLKDCGADPRHPELLENLLVPEEYSHAVAQRVSESADKLDALARLRQNPRLFDVTKRMYQLSLGLEESGIDELFCYVRSLIDDPELRIDHTEHAALYFVTFLPRDILGPASGLFVWKFAADYLQHTAIETGEEDEKEFIHDLLRLNELRVTGTWRKLISDYRASEAVVAAIQADGIERDLLSQDLKKRVSESPACQRIAESYYSFLDSSFREIEEIYQRQDAQYWQSIDIYHAFGWMRHGHSGSSPLLKPDSLVKDGGFAVILEDDPEQMDSLGRLVDSCSRYSMMPSLKGRCSRPEEVVEYFPDSSVGCYLIDIDNHEDRTAGIHVAMQLLDFIIDPLIPKSVPAAAKRMLKKTLAGIAGVFRRQREEDPQEAPSPSKREKEVTITVWSRSPELVDLAKEVLGPYIEEKKKGLRDVISSLGGDSSTNLIHFFVKLKTDSPFSWG